MNTLEMIIELRKNPNLKAVIEDSTLKVKCINGSIVWDNDKEPVFLNMTNCILCINNWMLIEENKKVELFHQMTIPLNKGIGELPHDKEIIGDIEVQTSDGTLHTIRPIGKKFAIPTNDCDVYVLFKYKRKCDCIHIISGSFNFKLK